jgi:hypothetical protein
MTHCAMLLLSLAFMPVVSGEAAAQCADCADTTVWSDETSLLQLDANLKKPNLKQEWEQFKGDMDEAMSVEEDIRGTVPQWVTSSGEKITPTPEHFPCQHPSIANKIVKHGEPDFKKMLGQAKDNAKPDKKCTDKKWTLWNEKPGSPSQAPVVQCGDCTGQKGCAEGSCVAVIKPKSPKAQLVDCCGQKTHR